MDTSTELSSQETKSSDCLCLVDLRVLAGLDGRFSSSMLFVLFFFVGLLSSE